MAFDTKSLRAFDSGALHPAGGRHITLFQYATPDTAATVEAANYFNGAAKLLSQADVIQAIMVTGGTPILKHYVVTSNNGTTVAIAIQTATAG